MTARTDCLFVRSVVRSHVRSTDLTVTCRLSGAVSARYLRLVVQSLGGLVGLMVRILEVLVVHSGFYGGGYGDIGEGGREVRKGGGRRMRI